jgi:CheY-like chemotaxis protein/HPt (histidine-containing phosphotransfer) domain-containing protein
LLPRSTGIEPRHKVLLVDDDAVSLELMAVILAHEGHQVLRANDAKAALALLAADKAARPDVMLVDLQMPGVSGGQLAEKVRALEGPEPLLLAMSATEVQRQQLLAFDGFLLKPLALGDLNKALQPKKRRAPAVRVAHPGRQRTVHKSEASASPLPAKTPVLDMAVVAKLRSMMPMEALHDVVNACIKDTRACIEGIQTQIAAGDASAVRQSAHRIKGAAAMIGASHLAALAAELEVGGYKEAATPAVLKDLLNACGELERMLLAGKFASTQGPQ